MKRFFRGIFNKIRYVWSIASITLLLLICIEILSSLILAVVLTIENSGYDRRVNANAYIEQDKLWLEDYYKEFHQQHISWEPYVYWRYTPYKGHYINIDEKGLRRTWNTGISRRKRIFVFGGSTVWGTGVRDDFTIPSFISRILSLEKGLNVEVINFGQSGYVTTQEIIALLRLLQNGQIPDLVIFYDGINDSFSAFQSREAGIPQNEFNRYAEFNSGRSILLSARNLIVNSATLRGMKEFMNRLKRKRIVDESMSLSNNTSNFNKLLYDKVVEVYQANIRYANQIAREFKFKTLFYWQPTVFTKGDNKSSYENVQELTRFEVRDEFLRVNKIIGKITHSNFTDLSNIFKDYKEPLYVDEFHLGEKGNELIARCMVQDIVKLLE